MDPQTQLRQDLLAEYQTLVKVISDADGRLLVIKGWAVTLSLAGIGLAFQQNHYAFFGLSFVSAAAFWLMEALNKQYQIRYYFRMREIEVATRSILCLDVDGIQQSSPRIDWSWVQSGRKGTIDDMTSPPVLRTKAEVDRLLRWAWCMPHVAVPHVIGFGLGLALFALACTVGVANLPL